ncbi:MAG TPA: glycosyltransferase, partial [Gemmatimonadales bacterium]
EAMACGVPVIASRTGGLPEVVEDGVSGFLVPVGDVAGMTERAVELLKDPARFAAVQRDALRRAGDFSAERIVPQYERLYEDVLRD